MTEKKQYEVPQMELAEIDAQSIICTSSDPQITPPKSTTEQLQEEEFTW